MPDMDVNVVMGTMLLCIKREEGDIYYFCFLVHLVF